MEVDAFLADSIVSAEGKLYVQGAGWNGIFVQQFPTRHARLGIGALISVDYLSTNQMHQFEIHIETSDGQLVPLGDAPPGSPPEVLGPDGKVARIQGQFNIGRPPILQAGDDQVVPLALNIDGLIFEKADSYSVVISIDGNVMKRLPLRIIPATQLSGAMAR
jgi:hypothetical protein